MSKISFQKQRCGDKRNQQREWNNSEIKKKGVVEPSVQAYYRRCLNVLKENVFDDENSKSAFLTTVFETLAEDGFKVLQNQTLSRMIESFLEQANFSMLNVILKIFSKNWDSSATDWFAHRVLQRTLEIYQNLVHSVAENDDSFDAKSFEAVKTYMLSFGAHMYENYPHYIQHQQASYILRTYMKLLCGIRIKVTGSTEEIKLMTPALQDYKPVIKDFATTFLYSPHLRVSIDDPMTNLFIQMIITCMNTRLPKKMKKFVKHLLSESELLKDFDEEIFNKFDKRIPSVFVCHQGSYFIERIVRLMPNKYFVMFFDEFIKENIEVLAGNGASSFILQRVIERADDKMFVALTRPLARIFMDIFNSGQVGIMVALMKRACNVPETQKQLVSATRRCLRCNGEDPDAKASFLACLAQLRMFSTQPDDSETEDSDAQSAKKVNLHGSLMAQSVLNFKKTGFITESFLNIPLDELSAIALDDKGSHIFDALFKSSTITQDVKLRIVERMKPKLCKISCDKYGSRIMDTLWDHLDNNGRYQMAVLLSEFKEKLRNDRFGHFVCRRYSLLTLHRTLKREWINQNSEEKQSNSPKKRSRLSKNPASMIKKTE